jgi:hypothetical protein
MDAEVADDEMKLRAHIKGPIIYTATLVLF